VNSSPTDSDARKLAAQWTAAIGTVGAAGFAAFAAGQAWRAFRQQQVENKLTRFPVFGVVHFDDQPWHRNFGSGSAILSILVHESPEATGNVSGSPFTGDWAGKVTHVLSPAYAIEASGETSLSFYFDDEIVEQMKLGSTGFSFLLCGFAPNPGESFQQRLFFMIGSYQEWEPWQFWMKPTFAIPTEWNVDEDDPGIHIPVDKGT